MSNDIATRYKNGQNIAIPAETLQSVRDNIEACLSSGTRKIYKVDWRIFSEWCSHHNVNPLPVPPEALCLFLTEQSSAGIAPSTLIRRLAAIKLCYDRAGFDSPTKHPAVLMCMKGIKRITTHEVKKKSAATVDRIREMINHCPDNIIGIRDKAILLLGFAGAFRRSELVALTIRDICRTDDGIKVIIRRSKTDQEGKGHTIAIPNGKNLRVVDHLFAWLKASKIDNGFLFRSIRRGGKVQERTLTSHAVAEIVKKYARLCGFTVENFSGHSLRSGLITSAAKAGASINKIMEISRHSDINTLVGYVRNENLFENHATEKFM